MAERRGWDPALNAVGRPIDGIEGDLERAVCESLYRSSAQVRQRILALVLVALKHGLRGVLFSWPLYMMGLAALVLPQSGSAWLGLFLLPGLWVSGVILWRGVRDDHARFISRVLLKPGAIRHILFPDT